MKYKRVEFGSYHLHMIKTNRFKDISVRISFREKIQKDKITIRNFLGDMLSYSTKEYDTARKVNIACQDLYSLYFGYKSYILGNYNILAFESSFLNPKYTEEGMLEKSIKFTSDFIFNPDVTNRKFNSESFNIIKKLTSKDLQSLKEDSKTYSTYRMLENMDSNSPISFRRCGYIEDLEKITESNLYDYYEYILKNDIVDIFVLGDIDFSEIENIINNNFNFHMFRKEGKDAYIDCLVKPKKIKTVIEEDNNSQSKLSIGCRLVDLDDYERKYPLTLYNIILGSGTDSKFFRDIRENNSLAYYIYSYCSKPNNLIIISSGINYDDMDKVVGLVKQKMVEMVQGDFSEKDIEKAKTIFSTSLEEIEDSTAAILESYYALSFLDVDDIETRKKMMAKVTKKEIIEVAKKVKIDTVYLLGGKSSEED